MPMRRLLMGHQVIHWASARTEAPKTLRGPVIATVALVALFYGWQHAPPLASAWAVAPTPASTDNAARAPSAFAGARFGDQVELRSVELACKPGLLEVRTQWARLPAADGRPLNHAVHLRDASGNIVGNFDYPNPQWNPGTLVDGVRTDRAQIPLEALRKGASIAIGLYEPKTQRLLPPDVHGDKPSMRMLLMPTPACPG
jgi:hypothetical protein